MEAGRPCPRRGTTPDGEALLLGVRSVRPRDAATLILLRRDGPEPRILVGKRHGGHVFMPNKFVFPGGRVDAADSRAARGSDLRADVEQQLLDRMRGRPSPARARGLAMAAIRETFEETGLILGRKTTARRASRHRSWQAYYDSGHEPDLRRLDFIARAITPPQRPRRYDTRFFLADATDVPPRPQAPSGELLSLRWLPLHKVRQLDLPIITRLVLDEVEARLPLSAPRAQRRPVPFFFSRRSTDARAFLQPVPPPAP